MTPTDRRPVLLSWSGGKDSALTLAALLADARYRVTGLLTTVAAEDHRVSHHGVREELLDRQAAALGLPLDKVFLPGRRTSNEEYEARMGEALARHRAGGVTLVAHGDIFLEDLRAYRERNLARAGMEGLFPLWGRDTRELVERFLRLGFRAYLCSVDAALLPASFAGREIDRSLLADLPADVDPCGENGEFHSFVWDGPPFARPVAVRLGERTTRDGLHFVDLLPAEEVGAAEVV